jgi:VanZ family protein
MSSDQGSMSQTSRFIRPLLEFLFPTAPEETLQLYHGYIRKSAHFIEYAVLAFFALRAFTLSSSDRLQRGRYLLPIVLAAAIACVDELNQSFSSARTGSPWDALIDISGAAAMMLFTRVIGLPRASSTVAEARTQ